jgi:hypothetical protein
MPSKEHMQLGWVARWVLSTPPGHPTAGRCGRRVVPVLPLLLCTRPAPARARPSIGGQRPSAPLRASSRRVLPRAGALAGCRTRLSSDWLIKPYGPKSKPKYEQCTSWPCAGWPELLPSPNEVTGDGVWACFRRPRKRKPTGAFLWLFSPHLKSQITSLSLTAACVFPPPPAKRRAASDGRNSDTLACRVVGTCVIKRTCTVSEDHICRVSQIRSREEGSSVRRRCTCLIEGDIR